MYRLNGNRVPLDLDGPTVEVERLLSWYVGYQAQRLWAAFQNAAANSPEELGALSALFDTFIAEAQPTWDIFDHHGAVPNDARGMLRLPVQLALSMIGAWTETMGEEEEKPRREEIPGLSLVESDAPTAVDAVMEPGAGAREVKRRLKAAKAA